MPETIYLSRELPLPPIEYQGAPISFALDQGNSLEDGPRVYLSTSLDRVDRSVIERLPGSVRLIANLGIGVDGIDLDAARERGLWVSNTPTVTEDTADLAFALLLAAARRLGANERFLRGGYWSKDNIFGPNGVRVNGKTLGIIGFGPIGQAVARRARGFGMTVLYWNRSAKPDAEAELGARRVETLEALVSTADFVSLHTALSPETRQIVDADLLKTFKPGSVLINTGRGELIDEVALAEALETGPLGAAGLDVFTTEPDVPEALLKQDQVVLTPHIGSRTEEAAFDFFERGFANIFAYLDDGAPLDIVVEGQSSSKG